MNAMNGLKTAHNDCVLAPPYTRPNQLGPRRRRGIHETPPRRTTGHFAKENAFVDFRSAGAVFQRMASPRLLTLGRPFEHPQNGAVRFGIPKDVIVYASSPCRRSPGTEIRPRQTDLPADAVGITSDLLAQPNRR